MLADHLLRRGTCELCTVGAVTPFALPSGRMLLVCKECDLVWCDHRKITVDSSAGHLNSEIAFCFEIVDMRDARLVLAQELSVLNDSTPMWLFSHAGYEIVERYQLPAGFIDHSGYVLSVGGCSVCDQDRVLAWVTVSGRLVFRCPDGHENTENSDGVEFPLWWVPDDEDASTRSERYANAGDIAAVIRASGPRSSDDEDLALFDVKWAILPRPEQVES